MTMTGKPTSGQVKRLPKAILHDHLDGGLRPETIIELAAKINYQLPTNNPADLADWFEESCNSGSLEKYLVTFDHTIAVMQDQEAIIRVARECAIDLAEDGVVYAEVRGAPELFTRKGLTLNQVIEATTEGFQQGMQEAARQGNKIRIEQILCALRQNNFANQIAQKVVEYRDQRVVAFDIAGPEDGFPPVDYLEAFDYLRKANAHYTIHAGEAFGLPSIWQALQLCGSQRLGHGVRIIDDIDFSGPTPKLGRLASFVRDQRIPLELAPTSNLQTGAAKDYASHPIGILEKLRFRVTLNTDNRLMSRTSMTHEMEESIKAFGWGFAELQRVTINALKSAFIPFEERLEIIEEIVKPAFAVIATEYPEKNF